jgi:formate dehydrogenase major subunit
VTAVQVTKVAQPSDWQRRYRAFSEEQALLLATRHHLRSET